MALARRVIDCLNSLAHHILITQANVHHMNEHLFLRLTLCSKLSECFSSLLLLIALCGKCAYYMQFTVRKLRPRKERIIFFIDIVRLDLCSFDQSLFLLGTIRAP